jgi:ribosomal protein S18 acetylase RimI-like enzyme
MELEIRSFRAEDEAAVIALWQSAGLTRPWNDPARDIARKLRMQPEWFLIGLVADAIVASVMAGYDGHRGWVYYLAVAPEYQRRGYARALMERAEALLLEAGCPKLNLQVRGDNEEALGFYERLGYATEERVSLGKRLEPDR